MMNHRKSFRNTTIILAALLPACSGKEGEGVRKTPPDEICRGISAVGLTIAPEKVRVGAPVVLTASGGSGEFMYGVDAGGSGGDVRDDRFIAGKTPGTDKVWASDRRCGGAKAYAMVEVLGAFAAAPGNAAIRPTAAFTVAVEGTLGAPVFSFVQNQSGGSVSGAGRYVAGAKAGLDVVRVLDSGTGDEVALNYRVSQTARFRPAVDRMGVPAGSSAVIVTIDGSDTVDLTKVSGTGEVAPGLRGKPGLLTLPADAAGLVEIEARDRFTGESGRIKVRVLSELSRPLTAFGRTSDVSSMTTGDFDGDKIMDLAVGIGESDLGKPQGGLVMIWKGGPMGLTATPTWTLTGSTETAQLGAVLATGDFDGDGKDDLAVAEPGADVTVGDSGAVELYRFAAGKPEAMRAPLSGLGRGNFGASLAAVDIDGNGLKDIIVGSPAADLAPTATINRRGIVDVFLMKKAVPIPDLGSIRLSGWDLAADGALARKAGVTAGRALAVGDLDGDTFPDLAFLGTVSGLPVAAVGMARPQPAIQLHFSRGGTMPFDESPDAYVLPANPADISEGTYRLGVLPKQAGRGPLLIVAIDQADPAANLVNAGAVYFFDVARAKGAGGQGRKPLQFGRTEIFAQIAGDVAGGALGRAFGVIDIDGDNQPEFLVGAPYVPPAMPGPVAGRVAAFSLGSLVAGANLNKPLAARLGAPGDAFGAGFLNWQLPQGAVLVAHASRANTQAGKFTGRLDGLALDKTSLEMAPISSADIPAAPALSGFGLAVAAAVGGGRGLAAVGAPNVSGIRAAMDGPETALGHALTYDVAMPAMPSTTVEGALAPLSRGGRNVGTDVAFTDFNGDGRPDLVVAAPSFQLPGLAQRATEIAPIYAKEPACLTMAAQATGGVFVHLGRADGSFAPAYRLASALQIPDCMPAADARCRRTGQGRGVVGGFDWNGDGKQDVATLRANGVEIFLGRAPDDESLAKLTLECAPAYSLPHQGTSNTSVLSSVGDLDGDRCDEIAFRLTPDNSRGGIAILFGNDELAGRCGGHKVTAAVRLLADPEVNTMPVGLGVAIARAGKIRSDGKDVLAVTAARFPVPGLTQSAVLLYDIAPIALAARAPIATPGPADGGLPDAGMAAPMALGSALAAYGDKLVPTVMALPTRPGGWGSSLAGNVDLTGDGKPDLVVGAPGASIGVESIGAVFVFAGGALGPSADEAAVWAPDPAILIVGDHRELGQMGMDVAVAPAMGPVAPLLVIGAPASYRMGTRNGSAFALPMRF